MIYIRKTSHLHKESNLVLCIYFTGRFRDNSVHEYWKTVQVITPDQIQESKERIRRLKIIRKTDIQRKKIEYLRFTRGKEGTQYFLYLNGKKLDPLDIPYLAEKIYLRREERHKVGKSSQINEDVIITFYNDRIIDLEFPTIIQPESGKPRFILRSDMPIFASIIRPKSNTIRRR